MSLTSRSSRPLFAVDPFDEGADLAGVGVVGLHGDAGAAGAVDQFGGLLDGLGAAAWGTGSWRWSGR